MSEPSTTERAQQPPEWSPFVERSDFERFWSLALAAAELHGAIDPRPDEGMIAIGEGIDLVECGMLNLAQSCAGAGPSAWEEIVEQHFEFLAASPLRRVGRLIESFAAARPHLRTRVTQAGLIDQLDGSALSLPSGMAFGLALDIQGHSMWLGDEHTRGWNRSSEELLLAGTVQVRKRARLRQRIERGFGGRVTRLAGSSLFSTGHLFDLPQHVGPLPEAGALVAVPTAREILVAPLDNDAQLVNDATATLVSAVTAYAEGPNALTPDVWWWRPGEDFTPALRYDGRPRFEGPRELREIFDRRFDMDE